MLNTNTHKYITGRKIKQFFTIQNHFDLYFFFNQFRCSDWHSNRAFLSPTKLGWPEVWRPYHWFRLLVRRTSGNAHFFTSVWGQMAEVIFLWPPIFSVPAFLDDLCMLCVTVNQVDINNDIGTITNTKPLNMYINFTVTRMFHITALFYLTSARFYFHWFYIQFFGELCRRFDLLFDVRHISSSIGFFGRFLLFISCGQHR